MLVRSRRRGSVRSRRGGSVRSRSGGSVRSRSGGSVRSLSWWRGSSGAGVEVQSGAGGRFSQEQERRFSQEPLLVEGFVRSRSGGSVRSLSWWRGSSGAGEVDSVMVGQGQGDEKNGAKEELKAGPRKGETSGKSW